MFSPVVALKRIAKLQFFPAKYHFHDFQCFGCCVLLNAFGYSVTPSIGEGVVWTLGGAEASGGSFQTQGRVAIFFSKVCCPR